MLVRAASGSERAKAALTRAEQLVRAAGPGLSIFFHGPGVELAESDARDRWLSVGRFGGARLLVCGAAWRRRFREDPDPGFEISSLARFWSDALQCRRFESYGQAS